ncbi:UvrB/UvrC motif-containing protein [Lutispora thermophila]|uniref:Protein-arginine kinase activator protein McsA n=1 Tax=Lutispora thermophila DSM 19022 TaxID=1122184 RepID=A0A1M6IBB1_9FIRM|nr:UvrB/UvrC motif-containing protein [Lutispora thermophila]SHJ31721.1 Protein-arginine kinase activator protein McsA [Lutispora thermophila DSM 19022]
MLCNECGKRPATVHITKIENGKKTNMHLCEQCALAKGALSINTGFSINDLLTGILNSGTPLPFKVDFMDDPVCPVCGMKYSHFRETGRFGCGSCYNSFGERLTPLFRRIHGNISHTGKIPNRAGTKFKAMREMEYLKAELAVAIKNEEYEKAAEIRDKIRALEKSNGRDE